MKNMLLGFVLFLVLISSNATELIPESCTLLCESQCDDCNHLSLTRKSNTIFKCVFYRGDPPVKESIDLESSISGGCKKSTILSH